MTILIEIAQCAMFIDIDVTLTFGHVSQTCHNLLVFLLCNFLPSLVKNWWGSFEE